MVAALAAGMAAGLVAGMEAALKAGMAAGVLFSEKTQHFAGKWQHFAVYKRGKLGLFS